MKKSDLKRALLTVLEADGDAAHPRWPKGTPGGRGGEFRPAGKVRDLKRAADLAAANLDHLLRTGGSDDEIRQATKLAGESKGKYEARAAAVSAQTRANREKRGVRLRNEAKARVDAERERVAGLAGKERERAEYTLKDMEDIARIAALNTTNDPNVQRQIGRAVVKGEYRKALKAITSVFIGGVIGDIAVRATLRATGLSDGEGGIIRGLLGAGKGVAGAAGKYLSTPQGRLVGGAIAALGATAVVREFLPGARRQRNHALLVKYDRNSRIEWQKHQTIFGKSGEEARPGQNVTVGHLRRPATYLGAEWRPHGANPTTTGRLIVQQGGKTRAVAYGAIKSVGSGSAMSSREAMDMARRASDSTWRPPATTGQQAFIKHGLSRLEPRLKHEVTAELRALRKGASRTEKALAYGLERVKSQAFSKELRRKRRRHSRPNSKRRYAAARLAAGTPRPGDRELLRGAT